MKKQRFFVSWSAHYNEFVVRDRSKKYKSGRNVIVDGCNSKFREIARRNCDRLNEGLKIDN